MAHGISIVQSRPQVAIAGDQPWHQIGHHSDLEYFEDLDHLRRAGKVLTGNYQLCKIADVETCEEIDGHRVVAWVDDSGERQYVGTVTDRYRNIDVDDIAELMRPAQEAGLAKLQTGMLLRNCSRVALSYKIETPESIFPDSDSALFVSLVSDNNGTGSLWPCYSAVRTVCDNTASLNIAQFGQNGLANVLRKISHKGDVSGKLDDLQLALSSVVAGGIEAGKVFRKMQDYGLSQAEVDAYLDLQFPLVDSKGQPLTGRAETIAINRRNLFADCYDHETTTAGDDRDTALRIFNASTYMINHGGGNIVRGKSERDRYEKHIDAMLFGKGDAFMRLASEFTAALVS